MPSFPSILECRVVARLKNSACHPIQGPGAVTAEVSRSLPPRGAAGQEGAGQCA